MSVPPSASAPKTLSALFRASNEIRALVLLGAGASFRSGVPMAAEAVKRIAKAAYLRRELGGRVHPSQLKLSQWMPWLTGQNWFIKGEDRLAENFPLAVEHLLTPDEFRREVLLDLMEPINGVSAGYHHLADFMLRGLVWTILTTNFDPCLPRALQAKQPHMKRVAEVNRGRDDFAEFSVFGRRQVVWLHGRAEQYTDCNLRDEVAHLGDALVSRLRSLVDDSPLIVIGYRGAEPSVMDDLLTAGITSSQNYRRGIYWCVRRGESLHPNVEGLARAIGHNFHRLEIDGFDELMTELAVELKGEDAYASGRPSAAAQQPPQAFDEQPLANVSLTDLDQELMLSSLGEYCRTVGRTRVTLDTLPALLRELGLVRAGPAGDTPTIGCCLLFASNLPDDFRHAAVAITRSGKGRTIVTGNLIRQRRELIDLLDGPDLNPRLKVKGKRAYEERTAYTSRAIIELVINLLVHRDYERQELAEMDVIAGRSMRFTNPGIIANELRERLQIDEQGRFRPIRTLSQIRNPSIADVFFGMRSMERAGTGLADVEEEMRRTGGDAAFRVEPHHHLFHAFLYQPLQAAPGLNSIARPITPLGLYVLNSLPITVLPERVSIATLKPGRIRTFFQEDLSELPQFISRGDDLWSFAPATLFGLKLADRLAGPVREVARTELEADADTRRVLSWMLRKHWEVHLRRFKDDGLFIERKKDRAFFRKTNGRKVLIEYDSPKRRGIKREVVKPRAEGKWHENEGIGYQIVFSAGQWAVRVKPFYMFTGRDGATPLPGFERTRRATRRIKFDRNKNVDDDLTFWSRFLAGGQTTISLGGLDIDDLIVDAAFLTIEVPEIGLLDDEDGRSDRMPA
jgi:hypothetical protein